MWLSGIIIIINSYGECASPRNMPCGIFLFAKVSPPAINPTFVCFFSGFSDEVYDFYTFSKFYYTSLRDHIIGFFVVKPRHGKIFLLRFDLIEDVLINEQ